MAEIKEQQIMVVRAIQVAATQTERLQKPNRDWSKQNVKSV